VTAGRTLASLLLVSLALGAAAPVGAEPRRSSGRSPAESRLACDHGEAAACEEIARAYRDGTGVRRDRARAITYYQRACGAGRAEACAEQAETMRQAGTPKLARMADFVELRACALGLAQSCARNRKAHPPATLSARMVAARASRACEEDDPAACLMLGHLVLHGHGVAASTRRAVELYRRACDFNLGWACVALARAYETGQGVKRDLVRSRALWRQACALDRAVCPRRRSPR
jgi:uncharacterized protein